MTDYLYHEHRGKAVALRQGGDTALYGVWYTRWLCPERCAQVVLLIKPENQQKVKVGSNGIVSAYGFELDEIVRDKKTGRRARVEGFRDLMHWRMRDGRKTRVPSGEYEILVRWIEPDPKKPDGRIMVGVWAYDRVKFMKRFRKQDNGE